MDKEITGPLRETHTVGAVRVPPPSTTALEFGLSDSELHPTAGAVIVPPQGFREKKAPWVWREGEDSHFLQSPQVASLMCRRDQWGVLSVETRTSNACDCGTHSRSHSSLRGPAAALNGTLRGSRHHTHLQKMQDSS